MSFASKVIYTGDGAQKSYNIPMPYLTTAHIRVFVDSILQLPTMDYVFTDAATIRFVVAPGADSAVEIKRETSPTNTLVDFQDGSVLNETDLDTSYLHNYYLTQEYADSFNEIINEALVNVATGAGIVSTDTDEIIAALVNEMLNTDAAANLQARITDIDANAEAILSLSEGLQIQINTLAQGIAANVYLDDNEPVPGVDPYPDPIVEGARWYDTSDNNVPYIYVSGEWLSIEDPRVGDAAAAISILQVDVVDNAAAVVTESLVRIANDTAIASELHLIGAQNAGKTAFIIDLDTAKVGPTESLAERFTALSAASSTNAADIISEALVAANATGAVAGTVVTLTTEVDDNTAAVIVHASSIDGIEAEYGVDLTSDGYVTGFRIINGGTPGESAFIIVADRFAIIDPSDAGAPGATEYPVFQIVNGKVRFVADVEIDGDLVVSGTINGSAMINGTIGTTQIGPNAIYSAQITADQITTNHLKALAVTAGKINVTNLAAIKADLGSITAGNITLNNFGYIKSSGASFAGGAAGFWLGYSSGYKFSIGNFTTGNYLKWDGSTLTIKGDLFVGEYVASDTLMLSANTQRTQSSTSWSEKKAFIIDRSGTVRLKLSVRFNGTTPPFDDATAYRVKVNGNIVVGPNTFQHDNFQTKTHDIAVDADDRISVEIIGGTDDLGATTAYIAATSISGTVVIIANGGTVDLN